jgi:hypothetical protein
LRVKTEKRGDKMSFKTRLEKIKEDEKLAGIAGIKDNLSTMVDISPKCTIVHPVTDRPATLDGFLPMGKKEADVILFGARDRIVEGGVFHVTPETIAAEEEVDRTYKAILEGGHDFAALSAACARWVSASGQAPAPPVTIALFSGSNK